MHSGIIGYFSRFPVVNLDGLANSYDHFHTRHIQLKEGYNFYRRYGVTHFANMRRIDQPPISNVIFEGDPFIYKPGEARFMIWTYDSPPSSEIRSETSYSAQVWDNMEPRFDYSSGSLGIVLAGRTTQAFVKDCLPDESLVWTWSERNRERIFIEPSLYRSSANMCVVSRIFPSGDVRPAQVKIAPLKTYFANLTASVEPIIRSDFDVYLIDSSLIYAKSECGEADIDARFFANIYPVAMDDLPAHLRQHGYETIDFSFNDYGAIAADGKCWAAVYLPNYPVAEIHAGQYATTADGYYYLWESTHRFNE